jgi:TRAP transporter TAXI family solute receptor
VFVRPAFSPLRRLLTLLSAAFACAFLASGAFAQDMKVIRIGAGPTGATDFPFGGLVANAISNPPGSRECERGGSCGVPGLIAVAQTTGGAMDNLAAVARGDVEMALSQADITAWAYHGTGAFAEKQPLSNLRVIARLYPQTIHLVARPDSGIQSIVDLKGKKVSMGAEGGGAALTARLLLSAFGVPWESLQMETYDLAAVTEALASKAIDAFFVVSGAPVLALEDLASRTPMIVVPIEGPVAEKLVQIFPFYSHGVIPPNTYGEHGAVATLDVGSVLVARDTMDPELAYGITRAIWHERNAPLFQAGHARGRFMDMQLAARGLGMPLHPGAAKFYGGAGVMTPSPAGGAVPPASPTSPTQPRETGG